MRHRMDNENRRLSKQGGDYSFTLLPIGSYSVRVEAPNFKVFVVPSLTLFSGDRARVDAQLAVGQISESVSVEAQAPALQADSSTIGSVITNVQDLPLNGRNFTAAIQMAPGTNAGAANALSSGTRPDDRRPGTEIFSNGNREGSNNFLFDGIPRREYDADWVFRSISYE